MLRIRAGYAVVFAAALLRAASPPEPEADPQLRIVVLEGEGALNNIRDHTARAPVVRVVDAAEKPVAGATVNFVLPEMGAGGTFIDGRRNLTATTDETGRAVGRGLRPNNVAGRFQIRVSVSWQGRNATAMVSQVNVAPAAAKRKSKTKYVILALVGGGAAGAVFAAKGGGKSAGPTGPTGTAITPGSPVFGPPR